MGELTTYFESDTIRTFLDEASDNINKFKDQNAATKANLADDFKVKNVIYERSVPILRDALDTVQAQTEIKDIVIKKMEEKLNIKNEDFIRQEKITVVMTKERQHARTALVNYLTSMKQPIQQSHQLQQRKTIN